MALLKGEPGNAVDYRNSGVSCSAKIGTGVEARKREIVFDLQDAARDCWQSGNLSEGCALDALMKQLQHEWAQPSPAAQVFRPAKARRRSSCHALHVPETTTVAPDIEYVNHTSYEAPLEMGVRPYLTW